MIRQVAQLTEIILGCEPLPEPESRWPAFRAALEEALASHAQVYDPISRRMRPWVDVGALSAHSRSGLRLNLNDCADMCALQ